MTDSQKAAQEILEALVVGYDDENCPFVAWEGHDWNGPNRELLAEKIREIIDKHLC